MATHVRCEDEHPDDRRTDGGDQHATRRYIFGALDGGV
jgi:hypothetical protein